MRIGVIAIQGNVEEHIYSLKSALKHVNREADIIKIKHAGSVPSCDALIIPGGESTTLARFMEREGIALEIRNAAQKGVAIMGTCAGLVLLAKQGDEQVEKTNQSLLGIMDVKVNRNAFGRQKESFESLIDFKGFKEPFRALFIRAPSIIECGKGVEILSKYNDIIVAAKQDNLLALAFHPELTDDPRIHHYFLKMIE
jgi:5'-phosphate synthase pdxT subunit